MHEDSLSTGYALFPFRLLFNIKRILALLAGRVMWNLYFGAQKLDLARLCVESFHIDRVVVDQCLIVVLWYLSIIVIFELLNGL